LHKKFDNTGKNVGSIQFSKRPDKFKEPLVRPYFAPEPRSIEQLEQGEKALGI